jgi:hypothetical protein
MRIKDFAFLAFVVLAASVTVVWAPTAAARESPIRRNSVR